MNEWKRIGNKKVELWMTPLSMELTNEYATYFLQVQPLNPLSTLELHATRGYILI
jgi:hypothetical protein